jgi:maleamate amidohydrolase
VGLWKSKAHKEGKVQIEGSKGVEITEKLQPAPEDFIIKKRRPSAFFRTDLDVYLNGLQIDTLIMTGTSMSGCVRATATDAFNRDYRTMIIKECVADRDPEVLESNLFDVDAKYCDVILLQEALDYLDSF